MKYECWTNYTFADLWVLQSLFPTQEFLSGMNLHLSTAGSEQVLSRVRFLFLLSCCRDRWLLTSWLKPLYRGLLCSCLCLFPSHDSMVPESGFLCDSESIVWPYCIRDIPLFILTHKVFFLLKLSLLWGKCLNWWSYPFFGICTGTRWCCSPGLPSCLRFLPFTSARTLSLSSICL